MGTPISFTSDITYEVGIVATIRYIIKPKSIEFRQKKYRKEVQSWQAGNKR